MNGRGSSRGASRAPAPNQAAHSRRAAEAAARVAARYAKAPSYSEMLACEARAGVDAAKAAAKAAEEAQAAFQYVLDGLEADTPAESAWKLEPLPARNSGRRAAPAAAAPTQRKPSELPRAHQEPAIHQLTIVEPAIRKRRRAATLPRGHSRPASNRMRPRDGMWRFAAQRRPSPRWTLASTAKLWIRFTPT